MPRDLSNVFMEGAVVGNNLLEDFLQKVKIRIIGYGTKKALMVERIDNYIVPSFLLVYYLRGAADVTHAGQTSKLRAGSFYVHKPFEIYNGVRISEEPLEFFYVNFDMEPLSVQSTFKHYAFLCGDGVFQQEAYSKLGAGILAFCQESNAQHFFQAALLKHVIEGIVAYMVAEPLQEAALDSSFSGDPLENVLIDKTFEYVEKHMSEPIDIGRMLRELGTSRSTLYRAFLRMMQLSPFKALTRFKMERSLELMRSGCSVTETAKLLGYSSLYHFSNIFKGAMGERPTAYMKHLHAPAGRNEEIRSEYSDEKK